MEVGVTTVAGFSKTTATGLITQASGVPEFMKDRKRVIAIKIVGLALDGSLVRADQRRNLEPDLIERSLDIPSEALADCENRIVLAQNVVRVHFGPNYPGLHPLDGILRLRVVLRIPARKWAALQVLLSLAEVNIV